MPPPFEKKTQKKKYYFLSLRQIKQHFVLLNCTFLQILETEVALKMFEHITNHIHKQSKQGCPDPSILEGLQQEF